MWSLSEFRVARQAAIASLVVLGLTWILSRPTLAPVEAQEVPAAPPVVEIPEAAAKTAADMKPYTEKLTGTEITFDMVPIPGGEFVMGSPDAEAGRNPDEGPQHSMKIAPFWMGKCEVTWDEYDIWSFSLDVKRRETLKIDATERDRLSDAVTRPTKPYTDMTFRMGHDGFPAICMTGLAARVYCEWLTAKTGRYYRLPTEAEWEYACRAGTTTAYSFGDDPAGLEEHSWFIDNCEKYQKVGKKKPNPWGLYDMHGNVAEWCVDQYDEEGYSKHSAETPFFLATKEYPQVVRGGGWDGTAEMLRSSARDFSKPEWKVQDPQLPKSRWYHTDARWVGFRVVRPLGGEDIKFPKVEKSVTEKK
jgi:formylglycine-generating enzyme required for sulfatase activity